MKGETKGERGRKGLKEKKNAEKGKQRGDEGNFKREREWLGGKVGMRKEGSKKRENGRGRGKDRAAKEEEFKKEEEGSERDRGRA